VLAGKDVMRQTIRPLSIESAAPTDQTSEFLRRLDAALDSGFRGWIPMAVAVAALLVALAALVLASVA